MKAFIINNLIRAIIASTDIIPYIIVAFIVIFSMMFAAYTSSLYGWGICGSVSVALVCIALWSTAYYMNTRLSRWIVESFSLRGKRYVAKCIMQFIHANYSTGTLPKSTRSEIMAFLYENAKDGLTEHERNCLVEDAKIQNLLVKKQEEENESMKKRFLIGIEYTRLFFCGKIANYRILEDALKRLILFGEVVLNSDHYIDCGEFSKADIRTFCYNIQTCFEIPSDVMAKFQKIVFAKLFENTKLESLANNKTKTDASKFPRVSKDKSLENIIEEMKA